MIQPVTENAKAALLLCGHFGARDMAEPLNSREYSELVDWLRTRRWEPADLLAEGNQQGLDEPFSPIPPERGKLLLERGAAMALALEKWINHGLWLVCQSDRAYPQRLLDHLKRNAPPILFGSGDPGLLSRGGLAVVGSRIIDFDGERFARNIGRAAAENGMQVVSGGAKGVDETAMHGAFEAGGSVLGVMADSLLRAAVSSKYREGIRQGNLLLVSTFNPEAGFSIGNAMGRNKLIYALCDFAMVVSSDYKTGGTWAGAYEELRREQGRVVFVRQSSSAPKGNAELMKLGGKPFPGRGDDVRNALKSALAEAVHGLSVRPKQNELNLD